MSEFTVSSRLGRLRWLIVAVGVAAVAVPLSFVLWHTPPGVAAPPPSVLPFLVPIGVVIPAISFGLGVALLVFGRKLLGSDASPLERATLVSVWWLLANWWPHSNFHRVSSGWTNVVVIDYFFHTTVIVASVIVAIFLLSVMRERQQRRS